MFTSLLGKIPFMETKKERLIVDLISQKKNIRISVQYVLYIYISAEFLWYIIKFISYISLVLRLYLDKDL